MAIDIEKFRKNVNSELKKSKQAFEGKYAAEINGLLGLSKEEIDKITPDATDLAMYDQLIGVVKTASATNVGQAQLKKAIKDLGETAVKIAKKVPALAIYFV